MTNQPDNRFLIVVLVFGIVGTCVGGHWLSSGSITIRKGKTRVGRAAPAQPVQNTGPVAGKIESGDLLYYPLCAAWIALGITMVSLVALSVITSNLIFFRLSAWTCPAILLLAVTTLAAALWYGP